MNTAIEQCLEQVRQTVPLIHNITNYVTVNDCANILLACGGSPIMADDEEEAAQITAVCGGLNINIGTLNKRTIASMFLAGRKANELGHPAVLDPVGAGASDLRTDTACRLLEEIRFAVVRGNISEMKTLAAGAGTTKGVDADMADRVTEENLDQAVAFAKEFASRYSTVAAISGALDIVADGERAYVIRNGHPVMAQITGSGCMLTAMTAAYVTANREHPLEAARLKHGGDRGVLVGDQAHGRGGGPALDDLSYDAARGGHRHADGHPGETPLVDGDGGGPGVGGPRDDVGGR